MGMLIAPYTSAMRLGCGFNSFTQTVCVNNAVVKEDRTVASDDDLRRAPTSPTNPDDVSQIVTYNATFVEHASEVLDAMSIKGNVSIKLDGLGGGSGGASYLDTKQMKGSDVNYLIQVKVVNQKLVADDVSRFNSIPNLPAAAFTETYGDSFISGFVEGGEFYALLSITTKDNVNKQDVAANISASISKPGVSIDGAVEGSMNKDSDLKDSQIAISVSWSGGGEIRPESDRGKDWTIDSMKRAAAGFAERVARCPQRTHAILTKYVALRSYQELTNKGTPLDYENAGVYTSALLDAYMDYKDIWKTLTTMTNAVQIGRKLIARVDKGDEFRDYAQEAQLDYVRKCQAYFYPKMEVAGLDKNNIRFERFQPEKSADKSADTSGALVKTSDPANADKIYDMDVELAKVTSEVMMATTKLNIVKSGQQYEPPLKPNELKPYSATLLGLDKARRDCRWEMIKIVKEVDAVTNDPTVATDTMRIWQYLNPAVFRQLIPDYADPPPPYTQEYMDTKLSQIADLTKQLKDQQDKQQKAIDDAVATASKPRDDRIAQLESMQNTPRVKTLEDFKSAVEQVASTLDYGRVQSGEISSGFGGPNYHNMFIQDTIKFDEPLGSTPRVISGISFMDIYSKAQPSPAHTISCHVSQATKEGITVSRSVGNSGAYQFGASWMTLPDSGPHIETGICDTAAIRPTISAGGLCNFMVKFQTPFKAVPVVRVWLQAVDWQDQSTERRVSVDCPDADVNGCTLIAVTWKDTTLQSVRLAWVAHEFDEPRIKSGEASIDGGSRTIPMDNSFKSYPTPFTGPAFLKTPKVFTAINRVDIDHNHVLRLMSRPTNVSQQSFDLQLSTWNDTVIWGGRCIWFAIA